MRVKTSIAAVALVAMGAPRVASAFKPEGHDALECLAYQEAVGDKATAANLAPLVLLQDRKYVPESGNPDKSLERQFDPNNQAFHFMATNEAVIAAAGAKNPEATILTSQLPKLARLMRVLFDEIAMNSTGAVQAGRGVPVLLHIVADSFSREHTSRDKNGKLLAIKGWQLIGSDWPCLAKSPMDMKAGNGADVLRLLHNDFEGGADLDWRRCETLSRSTVSSACSATTIAIQRDDLTTESNLAVDALRDLMVLIGQCADHHCDGTLDAKWREYWTRHFSSEPMVDPEAPTDKEREAILYEYDGFPRHHLSLSPAYNFGGAGAASLDYRFHMVPRRADSVPHRFMWHTGFGLGGSRGEPSSLNVCLIGGLSLLLPWLAWTSAEVGLGFVRQAAGLEQGVAWAIAARWRLSVFGHTFKSRPTSLFNHTTLAFFVQGNHPFGRPTDAPTGEVQVGLSLGLTTWHARFIKE